MLATIRNAKAKMKKTIIKTNGRMETLKPPAIIMKINANRLNPADKESKITAPLIPLSLWIVFGTAMSIKIKTASSNNIPIRPNQKLTARLPRPMAYNVTPAGIMPKSTIKAAKINANPAKALARIGFTFISPDNTLIVASAVAAVITVTNNNKLHKPVNTVAAARPYIAKDSKPKSGRANIVISIKGFALTKCSLSLKDLIIAEMPVAKPTIKPTNAKTKSK